MSHLYIHIPFCSSRCGYCDFATSTDITQLNRYVDLLCREIALLYEHYPMQLKTLYFGGGTPSLLPVDAFRKIFQAVDKSYGSVAQEVTVEVNPESADADLIKALKTFGVNRISMGMQAYQAHLLKVLGRNSRQGQVEQLVNVLQQNGITNYNIDCIYGIPGQTLADVTETVDSICDLRAAHVSAYALKLEPHVPMAQRIARSELTLPNDDDYADMLDMIIARLQAVGIARYEVSNFARDGYYSRHNVAYWSAVDTLAVGLAAAYKVANRRFYNTAQLPDYIAKLEAYQLPYDSSKTEVLSPEMRAYEYAILNLRTTWGIDLAKYFAIFNVDFIKEHRAWIDKYQRYGVLQVDDKRIRLNNRGLDTANYILSDL